MSRPVELPRWMDIGLLPMVNLALALAVCAAVLAAVGLAPLQVLALLVKGAFGSASGISYTLYYATTFVFTGLAVAVAFHGGLFNIGGEGQAMIGGLGCSLVALALGDRLPAALLLRSVPTTARADARLPGPDTTPSSRRRTPAARASQRWLAARCGLRCPRRCRPGAAATS